MKTILTAPEIDFNESENKLKVFLAGTIDNGNSFNWQKEICENINNDLSIKLFNPRRQHWNKDATSDELKEQILWELEFMDKSDFIIMNILENSKSPISLMEIGLHAKENKLIVFCSNTFYRFNNVKVVCDKYNIPLYETNDIDNIIDVILNLKK